jgi:predicted RND superfamily exporter protein
MALTLIITLLFLTQIPRVKTDTDPKNMLPATSEVRVTNDEVDRWFALHKDVIVLGIVNDEGIINPATLERITRITEDILKIPGVVVRDVTSLTTVDNVLVEAGQLAVRPAIAEIPRTSAAMADLRQSLLSNPLFVGRLLSQDGTTTAIYVPLESGANAKAIADRITTILPKEIGRERYYVAGDPVARDTFGTQMFYQMAVFSPVAGLVMFVVLWWMFRNLALVGAVMGVAMVSIVWSMGLMIGTGLPVHIMSSMIPVFLMAIATDSIHIFNEFFFRFGESRDKRQAILDTIQAVGKPVRYTALATAAAGLVTLTAFVSPYRRDRDSARRQVEQFGRQGDFVEVFVDAPLEVCEARDPKGLYRKARAGEIANFTGISDSYEPPEHPELRLDSAQTSADVLAETVIDFLRQSGKIGAIRPADAKG